MSKSGFKYIVFTFTCLSLFIQANAQRDTSLTKEVEVVKAYQPSVSDAYKINDIPTIKEEEHQKPVFDYTIYSQPIFSAFSVNTLQAAKIADRKEEEQGFGLLKMGAGNYGKPYVDFFFNNKDTKKSIFGLRYKHLSSHGKVKLKGEDKVKAPFSENYAEMFMKRYYSKYALKFNVSFKRDAFNYYGYPEDPVPSFIINETSNPSYFGTKQAFNKGAISLSLVNTSKSKYDPTLGFDLDYHYFGTKTGQREHFAKAEAHVSKPVKNTTVTMDAGALFVRDDKIFNRTTNIEGVRQQIMFFAKPAFYVKNDWANFKAGANAYVVLDNDEDLVIKATPNALLNLIPMEGIFNIFAGIDGNLNINSYSRIAYENAYVDPKHDVKNSFHQFRFFGGFDGKFSSKTNFKVSADYTMIKDHGFYYLEESFNPISSVTPTPTFVENDFSVLYDDMDMLKFNFEVYHTATDNLNLLFSANYYTYETKAQLEAWNLPQFDAKVSVGFNVTDQLEITSDLFLIGKRTGLIIETDQFNSPIPVDPLTLSAAFYKMYTLDTTIDMNMGATYHFTHNLAAFAQLNNFGFQKYERWLGYPVQGFNFLAGVSYSF